MHNTNYKVVISYDGSNFHGWAKQKNVRTVQSEIEQTLFKIFNEKINISGSGRTDAYVHAVNQVFSFKVKNKIKPKKLLEILNKTASKDILYKSIKIVNQNFHARFNAKSKIYEYRINLSKKDIFQNNYIFDYPKKLNLKKIKEAAKLFIGSHDFRSFSKADGDNTIRKIYFIKFKLKNNILSIFIKGNGFLRNMVRMIVGSLIDINENKKTTNDIKQLLNNPKKGSAISKIDARGLFLLKVNY